jgi:murein DD-endopeptidase MepM/ murein hydrolase activator NlpD
MSKRASGMTTGKHVRQGDVIGYVGSTGLATGPHVCYRFWKNGKQVDPFSQKLPDAAPIDETYKAEFLTSIKGAFSLLTN